MTNCASILSCRAKIGLAALLFVCLSTANLQTHAQGVGEEPPSVDVLISFHEPPDQGDIDLIEFVGGEVTRQFTIVPAVAATIPVDAMAFLDGDPSVDVIEIDGLFTADAQETPWGISKIEADVAQLSVTGAGVVVAVIDTGVNWDHPDLAANIYVNQAELLGLPNVDDDNNGFVDDIRGWDFVNNDNDPDDDHSHGTHCAGTIAGVNNDIGVVGVATEAQILPLKVLAANGSGSFSSVIAAVEYCTNNGVHVTSNSYGSGGNPGSIVQAAFAAAHAAGILNVASAGNSGNSNGTGENVGYPARYPELIAVAATNINDDRASFSSTGPQVELAAPGVSVLSTVLGTGYGYKSGTSMACPHVAGAAALLIEAGEVLRNGGNGQRLTNDETRQLLIDSSLDLGDPGQDNLYGHGRINVVTALGMLASEMHIQKMVYKNTSNGRHLIIRMFVREVGSPKIKIGGAEVTIDVYLDGQYFDTLTKTANSRGVAVFKVKDAPSGFWNNDIVNISAPGYFWDGSDDVADPGFLR